MNISYEVLFVYYLFVDGVDEVISEKKNLLSKKLCNK